MISASRLWALGAVIIAIGIAAAGWFLGISPQLDARTAAQNSLSSVQSTNSQLQGKVLALAKQSKLQPQLQAKFDDLNMSLPDSAATSDFVKQLNSAASGSGVTLSGIAVAAAQPYAAPAAPSAASSGAATPAPTPAPTAQPGMPPFTSSAVTGSNLAVIPVTITAAGPYGDVLKFVKSVQSMKRYVLVSAISTTPQSGEDASGAPAAAGAVTATITGDIFSITGQASSAGATPAATPAH